HSPLRSQAVCLSRQQPEELEQRRGLTMDHPPAAACGAGVIRPVMVSVAPLRCPLPAPPAVDKQAKTCSEEEQRTGFGCRKDKEFLRTTAIWGNHVRCEDLIPRKLCQRDLTASVERGCLVHTSSRVGCKPRSVRDRRVKQAPDGEMDSAPVGLRVRQKQTREIGCFGIGCHRVDGQMRVGWIAKLKELQIDLRQWAGSS